MTDLTPLHFDAIARTVHAALREWASAHGQHDIPVWEDAPDGMRASTRESIRHVLADPQTDTRAQHDQWVDQKRAAGWIHGDEKDAEAKTHPLMLPYDQLPEWERRKDALVIALVRALA